MPIFRRNDHENTNPIKALSILRKKLKEFLIEKKVQADKIFLTGDFRDASKQDDSDENAEKVVQYIREIAGIIGIADLQNILCVPGNHDLERCINNRQELICNTKRSYRTQDGTFEDRADLVGAFTFYRRVLNQLYGKEYTDRLFDAYKANPHGIYHYCDCNILMMNTELFAGEMVIANKKTSVISVQDISVTIASFDMDDYICITDMAKAKGGDARAADIIKNWIRNRPTLEFLGTWEKMYNFSFKVVEFDHFKMQAGLPTFVLSAKQRLS